MVGSMKKFLLLIMLIFAGSIYAQQLSIHGGGSMLLGFKAPGPWGGLHLGLEIPRDDAISFYGRYTHLFARKTSEENAVGLKSIKFDSFGNPLLAEGDLFLPAATANYAMDYNILEGGTRYYIGNGFDYGWAAYGGSSIMLIFNSVKQKDPSDYNEEFYAVDETFANDRSGSIFSLGFGLAGGVKFSSGRAGTFYLDLGLAYMIFAQGSTDQVSAAQYNPLIFNFALGYRRDILW